MNPIAMLTIGFQELVAILVIPVVLLLIAALAMRAGGRGERED